MVDVVWLTDMQVFEGREWENLPDHIVKYCGKDGVIECQTSYNKSVYDFVGDLDNKLIIPYGSIGFVNSVIRDYSEDNVVYAMKSDLYKPSYAMSHGNIDLFLNKDAIMTTWGILKQTYQSDSKIFIKPDVHYKTWTGHVWDTAYDTPTIVENTFRLYATDSIMLASPKEIDEEYRCLVVGGEFIDISQYSFDDVKMLGAFKDIAEKFAKEIIQYFIKSDQTYIVDIAVTDGIPSIIEFNSVNSSGLYGINLNKFVESVTEEAIESVDEWSLL